MRKKLTAKQKAELKALQFQLEDLERELYAIRRAVLVLNRSILDNEAEHRRIEELIEWFPETPENISSRVKYLKRRDY